MGLKEQLRFNIDKQQIEEIRKYARTAPRTENEIENEVKNEIPPNINDVAKYCQERKNGVNYKKWHNFYTGKGWMVGKNKMKDWQAAVRTWEEEKKEVKDWPIHPKSCPECFGNGYIIAPGSGGKFACREKFDEVVVK